MGYFAAFVLGMIAMAGIGVAVHLWEKQVTGEE